MVPMKFTQNWSELGSASGDCGRMAIYGSLPDRRVFWQSKADVFPAVPTVDHPLLAGYAFNRTVIGPPHAAKYNPEVIAADERFLCLVSNI